VATVYGGVGRWVGVGNVSDTLDFAQAPEAGDLILVWTYQSNENNQTDPDGQPIGASSAVGYEVLDSFDPTVNFRGASTLLTRLAVGDETDVTVTWGQPAEFGRVVQACFIRGVIPGSAVTEFGIWGAGVPPVFADDQLDLTIQGLGIIGPNTADGAFTAGSDVISNTFQVGEFRGAGWAVSAGNTSASPTATAGAWLTVSFTEAEPVWIQDGGPAVSYSTIGSAPSVELVLPTDGEQFQLPGTAITYQITASSVDLLEARVPQLGTGWIDLEGTRLPDGNAPALPWTSNSWVAGLYDLEVRGTSADGQVAADSVQFEWLAALPDPDTEPPTVDIVTPTAGAALPFGTTSATIAGTATDNEEVAVVQHRLNGGPWVLVSGTTDWSTVLTGLLNGQTYAVDVRATDTSGNRRIASVSFSVESDGLAPTVSIDPIGLLGATVTSTLLTGMAADVGGVDFVEVRVDGGLWGMATGTDTWEYTLDGLTPGGSVLVQARATDTQGNVSTVATTTASVNDLPLAMNDSVTTSGAVDIAVLANDTFEAGAVLAITAAPLSGNAAVDANLVTYVPNAGFVGVDSFLYSITNPDGGTAHGMVDVTVVDATVITIAPNEFTFDVGQPVDVDLAAGNADGFTWGSTLLPDGLSLTDDGRIVGTAGAEAEATVDILVNGQVIPIWITVQEMEFAGRQFLSPAFPEAAAGDTDAARIARARSSVADWELDYPVTAAELAAARD